MHSQYPRAPPKPTIRATLSVEKIDPKLRKVRAELGIADAQLEENEDFVQSWKAEQKMEEQRTVSAEIYDIGRNLYHHPA